jgi:hypothetical protein
MDAFGDQSHDDDSAAGCDQIDRRLHNGRITSGLDDNWRTFASGSGENVFNQFFIGL